MNDGVKSFIYGMVSPPSGAANVVVSANQNSSFVVGAVTFTNVNQLTPLGTYVGSGSAGDGTSGSVVVSSAAGEVVLSVGAWMTPAPRTSPSAAARRACGDTLT